MDHASDAEPVILRRIAMVGLRGFPDVQGGIESHVENICIELQEAYQLIVFARSRYVIPGAQNKYPKIRFFNVWSPKCPTLETLVHTFLCTVLAAFARPDVLHFHGIGPALLVPLARLFGLRVVVTHHGKDYKREKWGCIGRWSLKLGERFAVNYSHHLICVSRYLATEFSAISPERFTYIPNGVRSVTRTDNIDLLDRHGLVVGKYVLCVARLVPEKRQIDLIDVFASGDLGDLKLVLVGSISEASDYCTRSRTWLPTRTTS